MQNFTTQSHQADVGGRSFTILRHPWRRAVIEVMEHRRVVLRLTCNPDMPLTEVEGVLAEFINDEALPTPEEARQWGPAEDDLWRPSEGRLRPDGSIELAVTVKCSDYSTDHGVHRCIDGSYWTETGEDLGFEEGSSEDHERLADQVICFLGDELTEGQRYVLLLDVDGPYSSGQNQTHFSYSRKHWPPLDL